MLIQRGHTRRWRHTQHKSLQETNNTKVGHGKKRATFQFRSNSEQRTGQNKQINHCLEIIATCVAVGRMVVGIITSFNVCTGKRITITNVAKIVLISAIQDPRAAPLQRAPLETFL